MTVTLNGNPTDLPEGATLIDAINAAGESERRGVAVAVSGEVVPRGQWASRELSEGEEIEVVRAVQGG
jgi:sulfur carrier protein